MSLILGLAWVAPPPSARSWPRQHAQSRRLYITNISSWRLLISEVSIGELCMGRPINGGHFILLEPSAFCSSTLTGRARSDTMLFFCFVLICIMKRSGWRVMNTLVLAACWASRGCAWHMCENPVVFPPSLPRTHRSRFEVLIQICTLIFSTHNSITEIWRPRKDSFFFSCKVFPGLPPVSRQLKYMCNLCRKKRERSLYSTLLVGDFIELPSFALCSRRLKSLKPIVHIIRLFSAKWHLHVWFSYVVKKDVECSRTVAPNSKHRRDRQIKSKGDWKMISKFAFLWLWLSYLFPQKYKKLFGLRNLKMRQSEKCWQLVDIWAANRREPTKLGTSRTWILYKQRGRKLFFFARIYDTFFKPSSVSLSEQ